MSALRERIVGSACVASILALTTGLFTYAAAAVVVNGTPLVATAANEFTPAYAPGYLTFSQNSTAKPGSYNEFVLPDGGSQFKVNPAGTVGYGGGIDGTTLAYQQVSKRTANSDIQLYDVSTKTPGVLPPGVNTRFWEWHPTISGDWLLFNRNNINMAKNEWQKVILFNTSTLQKITLASVKSRKPYLSGDQVNGNYATWTECTRTCNVFEYNILSMTPTKIPRMTGTAQFYGGVTSDGTVYFDRAFGTCGSGVQIVRQPLASAATPIATMSSGHAVRQEIFAVTNPDTSVSLYYSRYKCKSPYWGDIYRIDNANTLAPIITPAGRSRPRRAAVGATSLPRPTGWRARAA